MTNTKEKLINIGLNEKEAEVYLSILTLGKGTVTDIARQAGIKRTSIYQYIETLLKEGLIFQTVFKKRTLYVPEDPKKIIRLLENKQNKIEKNKQEITEAIPGLEALYTASLSRPSISYYQGKDGIREVYSEILSNNKNVYTFFSPRKVFKLFSYEENDRMLMALYNNGGMLYNIIEKSDEAEKRLKIKKYNSFVKSKVLKDSFKFDTDLLIGKDEIAMISFDNLLGVIIKDKAIANLQKNIFQTIWKSLH
jgi:HTH-type transcriptional regulator, sugar sensing transcriptional regulator